MKTRLKLLVVKETLDKIVYDYENGTGPADAQAMLRASLSTSTAMTRSHYNDVIMSAMASQITGVSIVCPFVGSGADQARRWP